MNNALSPIDQTFSLQAADRMTGSTKLAVRRETSAVVKNVIISNIHENGRAFLTKTALDNVGALSALEAQLTMIAPNGAARYQYIVDAYALGAVQKIRGW